MIQLSCFSFLLFILTVGLSAQEYPCIEEYSDSLATHTTRDNVIESNGDSLSGTLYLPGNQSAMAVVILVPGGGNNAEILRSTPRFLSSRMAHCGIATLMFDKRGVGNSGGDYESTTFLDFVNDASAMVDMLSEMPEFENIPIGASGFSQGGRLVPNIAIKNSKVKFITSVSGPIAGVGYTRNYAFRNSVYESEIYDSVQQVILPIWEAQFTALDNRDREELIRIDSLIQEKRTDFARGLLPPFSSDIPRTPIYNSMGIDLVSELDQLGIPWLSMYGEWDQVVPVEESITNIEREMAEGGNEVFEIEIVPKGDHNLRNVETLEWYPMSANLIGWILTQIE